VIKAAARNDVTGRGVIVLGITKENIDKLKEGHPIHIVADELGFKGEIVIHYEKTMERLKAAFSKFITPKTDVRDHTNDKRN